VTVDLGTVSLEDRGNDRVIVSGATGTAPPETLKVVGGYSDGHMAQAILGYAWPDALEKARAAADIIKVQLAEAKIRADEIVTEFIGYDSLHGPLSDPRHAAELNEVYLRMAIRTPELSHGDRFNRLFPPLALSGPPFIGGYGGITPPRELLGIWPTTIRRDLVEPFVSVHVEEVTP